MARSPEGRFWEKVDKGSAGECWYWNGAKVKGGYGNFGVGSRRVEYAHRYSYRLFNGNIPKGLYVLHTCDNRDCVNPSHLWLGTQNDNMKDMAKKERVSRGNSHVNAKLTEDQVREMRKIFLLRGASSYKELVVRFSVSKSTVRRVVTGEGWTHVD